MERVLQLLLLICCMMAALNCQSAQDDAEQLLIVDGDDEMYDKVLSRDDYQEAVMIEEDDEDIEYQDPIETVIEVEANQEDITDLKAPTTDELKEKSQESTDRPVSVLRTSYVFFEDSVGSDDNTDPPQLYLMQGKKQRVLIGLTNESTKPLELNVAMLNVTASFEQTFGSKAIDLPPAIFNEQETLMQSLQKVLETPFATQEASFAGGKSNVLKPQQTRTLAYEFWVFTDMQPGDTYAIRMSLSYVAFVPSIFIYHHMGLFKDDDEEHTVPLKSVEAVTVFEKTFIVVEKAHDIDLGSIEALFLIVFIFLSVVYLVVQKLVELVSGVPASKRYSGEKIPQNFIFRCLKIYLRSLRHLFCR